MIYAHDQDAYPDDPADRTKAGNEHVNQARRFAKYWVYRQRGYETLNGWQNPDRITLAAIALKQLSPSAAEEYLGDLYQQFRSLHSDADPAVDVPDGVDPSRAVYKQDVYLGLDDRDAAAYAAALSETNDIDDLDAAELPTHDDGLFIESTSGVHVHWDDANGQYHTQWGDQPAFAEDRDPDGRLELLTFDPESITELKRQAVRNLLCQVRDCYLAMGIAPPERFRLLGHGRHDASTWYVHNDYYEDYYDPDADIETWFEEHTPENAYSTGGERPPVQPE
ncbi:MAG: hypothetical protein ACOC0Z_05040 [Halohasta sp.]